MPTFNAENLTTFAEAIFQAVGVSGEEAARVAKSLVLANLCGHDSHGLIRVIQYVDAIKDGRIKPGAPFQILKQTAAVLVVDGGWGLGQVQAHRLLERLIPRAEALGLAAGTLTQCGHIGRLGEYAEAAAAQKKVLISSVNNHGFARGVAPPGGKEARIGTNPLCIGVPTQQSPVILDIGTSVVAEGKVRVAFNKGQTAPDGWLLDSEGKPTNDASVLYQEPRGTIMPLGGPQAYKGFGIGVVLDMLVGGLSGGPCSAPELPNRSGNAVFFLVIDVDQFAGAEHFLSEASGLVHHVKTCPKAEGAANILLPGEPERISCSRRQLEGIPLDDGTWKQITALAEQLKLPIPSA